MSPILDFSNAASWVAGGFIVGLLAYWFFQSLFGGAGRQSAELFNISTQLDTANEQLSALRLDSGNQAAKATYYEGEFNKLFATSLSLRQDASEASRLGSELAAARKETENLHTEANEAAGKVEKTYQGKIAGLQAQLDSSRSVEAANTDEIGGLKLQMSKLAEDLRAAVAEIEGWRSRVAEQQLDKDKYDSGVSRLTADLRAAQNASGQASWLQSEVKRLTNEMSGAALDLQAGVEEKNRLGAEVARLTAALSSAYADLRRTLVELHTAKHDLQLVQEGRVETSIVASHVHRQGFLDSRVCDLG